MLPSAAAQSASLKRSIPQTAAAAQHVLESAGCAVELPAAHVCCGRPYYDFGMLAQARSAARNGVSLDTVLRRYFAGYSLLGAEIAKAVTSASYPAPKSSCAQMVLF